MPKDVKGGTLWVFLNIHSVAKYQKNDGETLWSNKEILEKNEKVEQSQCQKREKVSYCRKKSFGMAFYLMLEALDALKMKY